MRPFVFDFPEDEEALKQDASYMFSQSLLVSPVIDVGVTESKVYLPETSGGWYDWWNGEKIPVYVKAGSIIPSGPERQHVSQKVDGPVVINVYPGNDVKFTLYEDEGENYNYEKGLYSTISMTWDDAGQQLTIGKRIGSFPGMEKERK